jgi:hypothetical protein
VSAQSAGRLYGSSSVVIGLRRQERGIGEDREPLDGLLPGAEPFLVDPQDDARRTRSRPGERRAEVRASRSFQDVERRAVVEDRDRHEPADAVLGDDRFGGKG